MMVTTGTFASTQSLPEALAFDYIYPTGRSAQFNGTSKYLYVGPNAGFDFGTGDFTIEFWMRPATLKLSDIYVMLPSYQMVIGLANALGAMRFNTNDGAGGFTTEVTTANGLISVLNWYHVVWMRNGDTHSLFINGVCRGTASGVAAWSMGSSAVGIQIGSGNNANFFDGYLSNFRIVKGSNAYTYGTTVGSTYFISPTSPLTAISGTQLLLSLEVSPFTDTSTNALPVTNTTSVSAIINQSSATLFTGTWTDNTNRQVAVINGTPTYDLAGGSQSGGIIYSDLNTWISIPFKSTATSFTLSMAANLPASSSHYVPPFNGGVSNGKVRANIWGAFTVTTGGTAVSSGENFTAGSGAGTLAWYDFVFSGTSVTVYQNSQLFFSGTLSNSVTGWTGPLLIGRDDAAQSAYPVTFYRIRYVKSAYTQANVTAAFNSIFRYVVAGTIAAHGGLQFPGGVAGTRMLDLTTGFTLGAGSYTVEGWFQLPDFTNSYAMFGANASAGDGSGMMNWIVSNSTTIFSDKNGGGGSVSYTVPTMSANTWYHFALTRSGTTEALFMNGKRVAAPTTNAINYTTATKRIGMSYVRSWPGQMALFRVVVGTAVYDPNLSFVTIPVGLPTNIANTKYLMLGVSATTDSSGVDTVTNTGSVTITTAPY